MSISFARPRRLRTLIFLLCASVVTAVSPVGLAQSALAAEPPVITASATLAKPLLNPVQVPSRFGVANYVFWRAAVTFHFRITGLSGGEDARVVASHGQVVVRTVAVCNGFTAAVSVAVQKPAVFRSDDRGVVTGTIVMRDAYALTAINGPFSPTCGMALSVDYQQLQLRAGNVVKDLGELSGTYNYGFQ